MCFSSLKRLCGRLRRDRRGNVLILVGFSIIPLVFATGMGIDYSRAARLQTRLNAAADAAALAAVTQPMMKKPRSESEKTARNMFTAQSKDLPGLIFDPKTGLTVTFGEDEDAATTSRTVTVSYVAQSVNSFGSILGRPTITISGSSQSNAVAAPNIDFYVLLDMSQSMLLPATSSGLATMTSKTGGCAFGCHQTNLKYSKDVSGVPNNTELICDGAKKNCIDFLTVARNNNIVLRTDLVTEAVENLTSVALTTSADNDAKYRMGLSFFDYDSDRVWPKTKSADGFYMDDDLNRVRTHVGDAEVRPYYVNNWRTATLNDNDKGTHFTKAFNKAKDETLPLKAGNGTNDVGDTPQAILFIITDGMWDETRPGGKPEGPIDTSYCTQIKSRGVRIAVLNTQYLPESASDTWSKTNVKTPYLSPTDKITPALTSCASPGLFYQVTTDGDISAALAALFRQAVATAHLIQ